MIDGEDERLWINVGDLSQLRMIAFRLFLSVDEFRGAFEGTRPRDATGLPRQRHQEEEEEEKGWVVEKPGEDGCSG